MLRRLVSPLRGDIALAIVLFVALAVLYSGSIGLRASRGASITGDEPFYLVTTQSLLQDRNFDLRRQYEDATYRSFFDHSEPLWRQADPLPDGRLLSPHQPGLSVLLLPGFAIGGLIGAQVELLLIAAATYALAFLLISRETGRRWLALGLTAAVALSAPAFVYATEVYPETPAALCIVLALLLVRRSAGLIRGLGLVLALSALAWLGMKYTPVGIVIAAFYALRATPRERWWFASLGAASGAAYVGWHLAAFGALTPYQTNLVYEGASAASVLASHVAFEDRVYRLSGLFIDRQFGVGRWAPILLAVLPALPLASRGSRSGPLVVALVLAQVLVATFLSVTMMGWWFPGRMLIAVMPLFAFALTAIAARLPRPGILAMCVAGAYSVLVTGLLVVASRGGEVTLAVDPFRMSAWPFEALGRLFPQYTWWSDETVALNAVWLITGLLATLAVICSARSGGASTVVTSVVYDDRHPRGRSEVGDYGGARTD